ncbi:MAG: hypothetical protein HZC37_12730 [Burkholderiales bacterium]|nr:hypothetical protein [Burkholderiales bacterium]
MRTLLLLLLLANGMVFAWAQGWLEPALQAPSLADREPGRLAAQVHAEAVRVLPQAAGDAAAARPAALRCVEVGPFGLVDAAAAEAVLEAGGFATGTWERDLRGPAQVWLRMPRADAALRERLNGLAATSPLLAGGFRACAATP